MKLPQPLPFWFCVSHTLYSSSNSWRFCVLKYWSLLEARPTKSNWDSWDLGYYLARCWPSPKMVPSHQERPVLLLSYDFVLNSGSATHCQALSSAPSTVTERFSRYLDTPLYQSSNQPNEMWIHDTSITCCSTEYHQRGRILSLKHKWDVRRVVCNNMRISVIHLSIHWTFSHPQTQEFFLHLDAWWMTEVLGISQLWWLWPWLLGGDCVFEHS